MPWFASTFLGITRTTTLTCQRSQVGVLSRNHPQNAATPVPFATFAGTNCTRHAHCLIAPTARTRRDPDHRVAESPSADNARGCGARRVSNFTWEFEFLNPHTGPELDVGCAHSEVNQRQTGSTLRSMRRSGTNQMSATST